MLQVGDKVKVMDEGLLMLMKFAPKDSKPINEGVITELCKDGTAIIEFPIDGNKNHTQIAPYPLSKIIKLKE